MKRDHRGKLNRPAPSAPSDESKERDSGTSGLLATSRRDFLKYAVGSAALLGPAVSSLTASAQAGKDPSSTRASKKGGNGGGPKTEKRTYLFDLSYMDTSAHEVIMVAGGVREPLESISSKQLAKLRHKHPILELVPYVHLTHIVTLKMPADAIQLCYVQRIAHAAMDGSWDMSLQFYHLPASALQAAREREATMLPDGEEAPVPVKWARYGLSRFERTALADPVGEDMLKDTTDQATALIAGHPEIACGDPTSAAYIQCSIIGTQSSTMVLGDSLTGQGPATPTGGWATQTPLINPDTGQQAVNSLGQLQYLPVWSSETNQFAGQAIQPSLTSVKGDTTLGVNVTNVDPTQTATLGTTTSRTFSTGTGSDSSGAIWTLHDGMSTVDQSPDAGQLAGSGFSYTFNDQSPGHGYSITVSDVTADSVTFTAKNWFVRYLGLYVRYLDSDGNPIPVDTVVGELGQGVVEQYFPLYNCCSTWNTANDLLLDLAGPEFEILGIPVSTTTVEHTIPIPTSASSVLILASGLGSGSNDFADTTIPGKVMTGVFNLALPTFFLYFQAAGGVATLDADLEDSSILITDLPLALELFADMFAAVAYDDPASFATLGVSIAEKLLSQGAAPLITLVATALAGGETESAVLDALPIVGNVLAAIFALGTAAAIAETSAEVAQSPNTYVGELVLTHDIDVTIQPDDPAGFPATATSYTLTAQFDGGTPHTLTLPLPTVPAVPQVATFQGVPLGGQVTVSVGFYTTDNWLAGQGSIGPLANVTDLAPEITITENLVPLTSATVYSHKELIVLDDQGNHIWLAQTTPPSEVQTSGCDPVNGQLCALSGITVSTTNADVGQAWQAYNGAVNDCSTNAPAQLQQFSNISSTETPQSEYLFSGCGFEGPVRVAYDLLGRDGFNFYLDPTQGNGIIRQIRLSGSTASFDGPFSNQAWGKLSFPSDAFLLHPVGQIISVNTELSKIEVLKLPAAAVADSEASPTQAYGGVGVREGLMTAPTHAALSPKGAVIILETGNNRIQAFDLNANPAPLFDGGAYFVPLTDTPVTYLDLAVEYSGYMYVLSLDGQPGDLEFRLDIYTPGGAFLSRTTGVNAARLAVNYWRDIFTQNYQVLTLADGSLPARTEPSISHWIPSTP